MVLDRDPGELFASLGEQVNVVLGHLGEIGRVADDGISAHEIGRLPGQSCVALAEVRHGEAAESASSAGVVKDGATGVLGLAVDRLEGSFRTQLPHIG